MTDVLTSPGATWVDVLRYEVVALTAQVCELRNARELDRETLDELMAELARRGVRPFADATAYDSWIAWVDEWLAPRLSRDPRTHHWCTRYAEHPEVADRLEAVWHTWENQWPDVRARSVWLRDELDHHLAMIMADDGPLRACSAAERIHIGAAPVDREGVTPSE